MIRGTPYCVPSALRHNPSRCLRKWSDATVETLPNSSCPFAVEHQLRTILNHVQLMLGKTGEKLYALPPSHRGHLSLNLPVHLNASDGRNIHKTQILDNAMSTPLPDALGTPLTWIQTNVFTAAPQKLVNSFQTPTHKENNSDLSALVFFRPSLTIKVGDIGGILPVQMGAMLIFTNQMNDDFISISLALFQRVWKIDAGKAKKAMTCASEVDFVCRPFFCPSSSTTLLS
ncbi:hypothetical protein BLNAU_884 [Blattamonas nauphoetae]|uniref:Uncharacterized protein n=1 Tax=Blattamonas nauphoetae TaxID=2049346 RepID=A0ABQ9YKS4_9EUKA|nr:hypothetical protein BLNAU_884 [Blattamonas nauphoetae]